MKSNSHCLINQPECGRIVGKPVCPKCGMDERVIYPGQSDREAAQAAATARYLEALAPQLQGWAKRAQAPRTVIMQPVTPSATTSIKEPFAIGSLKLLGLVVLIAAIAAVWTKVIEGQQRVEEVTNVSAQAAAPAVGADAARKAIEPEMVTIPAGSFTMGISDSDPKRRFDEVPQHTVGVSVFELGKYEVTFAQWDACVADGGCQHNPADDGWGRGNRPVIKVSWNDITQQYIPWINRKTGKQYRLPSESEWEYAARAGCAGAFSVGGLCADKIEPSQANFKGFRTYSGSIKGDYLGRTVEVGQYEANRWGLYDMHGNVSEWVQDCWSANYQGAPTDGRERSGGDCGSRVHRGGAWNAIPQHLRSSNRARRPPDDRYFHLGFRLARTVP
jgi:formylglycine-generating enzyme required for sulfatase activity